MSTYRSSESGETPTITLTKNPDGRWTARDIQHEISAEGGSREEALENLDAVVEAVQGEGGREPTEDELRELGIDPDEHGPGGELPDVLE